MILVVGELRKVELEDYTIKGTGEVRQQGVLVIEPKIGRRNIEVFLTNQQVSVGLHDWQKLRGKSVSVPVSLFVSKEHGFHKFNLQGAGKPLPEAMKEAS